MKSLRYPFWLKLVDLIGTIALPIAFILWAVFDTKKNSAGFQITFTVILTAFMVFMFIKKFVLDKYLTKLTAQEATLEVNYKTGVGDKIKTKAMWSQNKLIANCVNMLNLFLIGLILFFTVHGLQSGLLTLRNTFITIALMYIVTWVIKSLWLIVHLKEGTNEQTS